VIKHGIGTHGGYHRDWYGAPAIVDNELRPGIDIDAYQETVTLLVDVLTAPENAGRSLHDVLEETELRDDMREAMLWEFSGIIQRDPRDIDATSAGQILGREAPYTGIYELTDGYSELWRRTARPFTDRIELETPVSRVRHSAAGVEVTTARGTYTAQTAIITPSVGVLQSDLIAFDPPLPEAKAAAISGLQMGTMIKIGAHFRRPVWEAVPGYLETIGSRRSIAVPTAKYVDFWYLTWPSQAGTPLLVALLGAGSEELTGDHDRIVAAVRADLELAFGKDVVDAELQEVFVEDWVQHPYVRGYASSIPFGGYHFRADLAAPTPPLFWAGEACATDGHAETVEAAISTGRTAAVEALQSIRPYFVGRPDSRLDWSVAYD
jgi:monoamine oxidase